MKHSLDNQRLCFLSVSSTENGELKSISFDVEAADDYHYKIEAEQIPTLCEALSCAVSVENIVAAFREKVKAWSNPIEIAPFLQSAGVKYQVFHWH